MKIILFVSGGRGLHLIRHLKKLKQNFRVVCVENKQLAREIESIVGFNIWQKTNINEKGFLQNIESYGPDVMIVAGFPTRFKERILDLPKLGVYNLHGGPLPKYRGGSPLNWQIIKDESHIGVTLLKMDTNIDTGPVVETIFFECTDQDDINSIHIKANEVFANMVERLINSLKKNRTVRLSQQEVEKACYWSQRTEGEGRIDWNLMTGREVFNLIRALKDPYPRAFSFVGGKKLFFNNSIIPKENIISTPGKFFFLQGMGHYFMCKDKAILAQNLENIPKIGFCDR